MKRRERARELREIACSSLSQCEKKFELRIVGTHFRRTTQQVLVTSLSLCKPS